jgi:23S rRNA (cytosine1962-C5)-methyltransferase
VRVCGHFNDEPVDKEFFRKRIRAAIALRRRLQVEGQGDAYRLIHGESDGIPGFVVDRYKDVLVLQSPRQARNSGKKSLRTY